MKNRNILSLLLLCCFNFYPTASSNVSLIANTTQKCQLQKVVEMRDTLLVQERIRLIENFYRAYMTNGLLGQQSNDLIKKQYLTKRLNEKIDRVTLATGADPVVRAQDFSKTAIETLRVRYLYDDWFMVDYKWSANDDAIYREIPLKVIQIEGRSLIDYITPEWNNTLYGDSLLCFNMELQPIDNSSPLTLLNTFYSVYIYEYCSMPENLTERLAALRKKYFTSNALAQFEESFNESKSDGYPNYDLLIDYFDFDCLWIPTITFTQLDEDTYQMGYLRWKDYPVVIVVGITEKDGEYKIDSIRVER